MELDHTAVEPVDLTTSLAAARLRRTAELLVDELDDLHMQLEHDEFDRKELHGQVSVAIVLACKILDGLPAS
jgi:hypothetical protein